MTLEILEKAQNLYKEIIQTEKVKEQLKKSLRSNLYNTCSDKIKEDLQTKLLPIIDEYFDDYISQLKKEFSEL